MAAPPLSGIGGEVSPLQISGIGLRYPVLAQHHSARTRGPGNAQAAGLGRDLTVKHKIGGARQAGVTDLRYGDPGQAEADPAWRLNGKGLKPFLGKELHHWFQLLRAQRAQLVIIGGPCRLVGILKPVQIYPGNKSLDVQPKLQGNPAVLHPEIGYRRSDLMGADTCGGYCNPAEQQRKYDPRPL